MSTVGGKWGRALQARDQHCVWPGCERSPSSTNAHHLVHWARGGGSELQNLVLLCYRHHWLVHEGGWQIVKASDGRFLPIAPVPKPFCYLARAPGEDVA